MSSCLSRILHRSGNALAIASLATGSLRAQVPETPPVAMPVPAEVFDALTAIEATDGTHYAAADVQKLLHAVWWDLTFSPEEVALARALGHAQRPVNVATADGRQLAFSKLAANDASRQQRFLLPPSYDAGDSSYFIQAFRNTKDVGVYMAACRVHENAAEIMEAALTEMVNQARLAAKSGGDGPITRLFDALDDARRAANPAIQTEFAAAVRRVVGKFEADRNALPESVRNAPWLQAPGG